MYIVYESEWVSLQWTVGLELGWAGFPCPCRTCAVHVVALSLCLGVNMVLLVLFRSRRATAASRNLWWPSGLVMLV